jgi:hypothetical protein
MSYFENITQDNLAKMGKKINGTNKLQMVDGAISDANHSPIRNRLSSIGRRTEQVWSLCDHRDESIRVPGRSSRRE